VSEDLEPLHRPAARASGKTAKPCLEHPIPGLKPPVLLPQTGHLADRTAGLDGLLQEEQTLLRGRLGGEHCGSDLEGGGSAEDLHGIHS
jgi:hypothetical protein